MRDTCWDCGVAIGQSHDEGCDVARCLFNGSQRLSCSGGAGHNAIFEAMGIDHTEEMHDCGQDVHNGEWPGEADAIRLGWWAYFVPGGDPSWVRCGPGESAAAMPDLNRLAIDGRWDRETLRLEKR
jgi:hypothetical protein